MFPLKKIICPTDFSEPSFEGLKIALEMVEKFDAELIVAYVIEPPGWSGMAYAPPVTNLMDISVAIKEEASKKLNKMQSDMIPEHIRYRLLTVEGKPAEEIVKLAQTESAGLIVIATHGYSGLHRFVFGSVTERVVRTSKCPVLTVRPTGDAA
jgi:nucleotide-binding universal stress UspA family protein